MFGRVESPSGEVYRLRPMNCPHHHIAFRSRNRSYKELPFRVAEFGQVYRYENSGSLHGLMRARSLCINDAHIYVSRSEVGEEIARVMKLHHLVFEKLGIEARRYRLSCWDPLNSREKFLPEPAEWDWSQGVLREVLQAQGIPFEEAAGEAAFYGPKIDFQIVAASGKEDSISSIQLDFASAKNFGLKFRNARNEIEVPVVLHRAPIGSFERMLAYLLEQGNGNLPLWLSPIQVQILPLSRAEEEACRDFAREIQAHGIRAKCVAHEESVGRRLQHAYRACIPIILIVGKREESDKSLSIKAWDHGKGLYREIVLSRLNFVELLLARQQLRSPGLF